ncbi:2,3-dehydroadipyl-CoA hydratase [Enhygromyxa salina]|uniref:2,3-dehydroadipyl-CoA hydratase n=1 Tax=Enhygromyxa salina TaxID=215803 RepID=A0A2S9YC40_9BACT|nr:enoyl-CoA hydratase/isomerase family protein [Enhygromyxa salina]PRQ02571.1 2,3-dehydroadipyl-CoA hydratase [Enhygromyxa salina]
MTSELVLTSTRNRVTTLTMNMPARLNGWTGPMMEALMAALARAADDADSAVVILTGADPYYCAGVNLSGVLQLGHPRTLRALIVEHNKALFEVFLRFPKPILVAANGPAIGASVTSAVLCDAIIASERATFSTPFGALGITPEGCSSALFPQLFGEQVAARLLGAEGWKPTGTQAHEIGLAEWVVPHEQLLDEAQRIAEGWADEGRARTLRGEFTREQLEAVNAEESEALADAFLASPFLAGQFRFLWGKKKRGPALMFLTLQVTRPLWSRLL